MSASFYLDKGVRHPHREKRKVRVDGKTRTETVERHHRRVKIKRIVTVTKRLKPKLTIC